MIYLYADNYFYIQVQLLLPWALVHRVNNHTQPHVDKQTLLMVVTALHIKGSYGSIFLRWEYCVPDFGLRRSTCSPSRLPRPSRPPEQGPRPRRSHRRRGGRGSGGGRAGAPQWGRWRGWWLQMSPWRRSRESRGRGLWRRGQWQRTSSGPAGRPGQRAVGKWGGGRNREKECTWMFWRESPPAHFPLLPRQQWHLGWQWLHTYRASTSYQLSLRLLREACALPHWNGGILLEQVKDRRMEGRQEGNREWNKGDIEQMQTERKDTVKTFSITPQEKQNGRHKHRNTQLLILSVWSPNEGLGVI